MAELEFIGKDAIIGRSEKHIKKYGTKGTAYIGKVVMSAGERPVLGRRVLMDISRSHVVLICGKRGGGKSYTMSVIIEEFCKQPPAIRNRLSVIVIDTVGIFWTLKIPNKEQEKMLYEWDLEPKGVDVRVLVPKGKMKFYLEKGLPIDSYFVLRVSELDITEWMALFKLTWKDPEGVLLTRVLEKLREGPLKDSFGIDDIIKEIDADKEAEDLVKKALINRMRVAKEWGIFEATAPSIKEIAKAGTVNIIDVSSYRQAIGTESIREIIVALLGKKLFEERMLYRKEEEAGLIKGKKKVSGMPIVWMMIDEAHMFMPKDRSSIALPVLLEWVRVGRQPGLSLLLATQRPNKLHPDCLSQCDLFISHRMTAQPDIEAVGALRPSYMQQDFGKYYKEMPRAKGFALILDDNSEKLWIVKIRPRLTWDGGKTASAFTK